VTTVDQPRTDPLTADQLRADALRWVLNIADTHHLPLPVSVRMYQYVTGWHLQLHLDDDQGDDVRRWADVLDLPMCVDMHVTGTVRRFTAVTAAGTAHVVFAGWDTIRIDSYTDFAPAAPLAVAA
jgi:hypothetical protein